MISVGTKPTIMSVAAALNVVIITMTAAITMTIGIDRHSRSTKTVSFQPRKASRF